MNLKIILSMKIFYLVAVQIQLKVFNSPLKPTPTTRWHDNTIDWDNENKNIFFCKLFIIQLLILN